MDSHRFDWQLLSPDEQTTLTAPICTCCQGRTTYPCPGATRVLRAPKASVPQLRWQKGVVAVRQLCTRRTARASSEKCLTRRKEKDRLSSGLEDVSSADKDKTQAKSQECSTSRHRLAVPESRVECRLNAWCRPLCFKNWTCRRSSRSTCNNGLTSYKYKLQTPDLFLASHSPGLGTSRVRDAAAPPECSWTHTKITSAGVRRGSMHAHAPTSNSFQQAGRRTRSIVFVRLRHGLIVTSYLYANFVKIPLLSETLKDFFIAFVLLIIFVLPFRPFHLEDWARTGLFLDVAGRYLSFFFFFYLARPRPRIHVCLGKTRSATDREKMKRPIRAGHNHVRSPGRKRPGGDWIP